MPTTRIALLSSSLLLLVACGQQDPPTTAPANVSAAGGESFIVLDWDMEPNRVYWAYYKEGNSVSQQDNDLIVYDIEAPYFLEPLDNDITYAVSITSSRKESGVGPFSPVITATPRLLDATVPWSITTPFTTENLNDAAYDEDYFAVVGDAGTVWMGTSDYLATEPTYGTAAVAEWVMPTLPSLTGIDITGVITDGDNFVGLGSDGTIIRSSDDDILIWETATSIPAVNAMNAITISTSRFIAVGDGGEIHTNTNGDIDTDWEAQVSGTSNDLKHIAVFGNTYVALGASGTILTSTNSVDWTQQTSGTTNDLHGITFNSEESVFIAVGDAGTLLSSDDLETWTVLGASAPTDDLRDVMYTASGQLLAIGNGGTLAYSDDGADGNWVVDSDIDNMGTVVTGLNAITVDRAFIVVGDNGAVISGK